jgi:hypothetical protein
MRKFTLIVVGSLAAVIAGSLIGIARLNGWALGL